MLNLRKVLGAKPKEHVQAQLTELLTPWGEALDPRRVLQEHPEPQLRRDNFLVLNGPWECAFVDAGQMAKVPAGGRAATGLATTATGSDALAACSMPNSMDDGHLANGLSSTSESPDPTTNLLAAKVPAGGRAAAGRTVGAGGSLSAANLLRVAATAPVPGNEAFDSTIVVPFSPEAPLSGVRRQLQPDQLLWYRRALPCPDLSGERRCLLHFQAVDYACALRVNGQLVGTHAGGYLPFTFDITDWLRPGDNQLALCVADPSEFGGQPRGKQRFDRGDIWYTAQSGIWQTVWLEIVPVTHITRLQIEPDPATGTLVVGVEAAGAGESAAGEGAGENAGASTFGEAGGTEVGGISADDTGSEGNNAVAAGAIGAAGDASGFGEKVGAVSSQRGNGTLIHLEVFDAEGECVARAEEPVCGATGAVGVRVPNFHLWSPEDPYLYQLKVSLGEDVVYSYGAFRTVEMRRDAAGRPQVFLNGQPLFIRGVLDQAYWPDGLMTAPSDEALVFDIQAMRDAGFNLMRKHIKVENARWYYHCDRLGMLVLQDMVQGGDAQIHSWDWSYKPTLLKASWARFRDDVPAHWERLGAGGPDGAAYRDEWTRTCRGTVRLLRNHPCVIGWSLFNEGWGQFNARAAFQLVRRLDPSRLIDAVSGWYDQRCGDFYSVHNYFRDLDAWPCPYGRAPFVSEFGGYSHRVEGHSSLPECYGYEVYDDPDAWRRAVIALLAQMNSLEAKGLAGYIYTQVSDIEEETNGLLTYDRRINKLAGSQ